jgi:hypothetical protein
MAITEIYLNTNITTGETFNRKGEFFRDDEPNFPYKSTFRMLWQLYTDTPNANLDGTNPEVDWTKADFTGCGALLTCDDDFIHRLTGTLKGAVTAGTAVTSLTVTIPGGNDTNIPSKGYITLADANGGRVELGYSAITFSGADAILTVESWTPSVNISAGAKVKISQEAYFQAPYNAELSDPENGLFVFDCTVYSNKLAEKCDAASDRTVDVMGIEILPFTIDENNVYQELPSYICDTASIVINMGEAGQNPQTTELLESTVGAIVDQKTASKISAIDSRVSSTETNITGIDTRVTALENGGYATTAELTAGLATKADSSTVSGIDARVSALETAGGSGGLDSAGVLNVVSSGGYVTSAYVTEAVAGKADTSVTDGLDARLTALSGTVDGKISNPAGGTAGQVLTKTDGGVQWSTVEGGSGEGITTEQLNTVSAGLQTQINANSTSIEGKISNPSGGTAGQFLAKTDTGAVWSTISTGIDSAGVLNVVSSGGYTTSATVSEWLNAKADASTVNALDTRMTAAEGNITGLNTGLSSKADVSVTSALDTRVSALEISGGGTTVTAQPFSSAPNNKVAFTGNIPVGVMTNSGKYYPVEKGSLTISGGVATLDVTPYLAYDNSASFSGTWTAYFATGTGGEAVLEWLAPDASSVTDIPAWNTVYQAANACWIAVSIVGCAGAVLLGTEVQYVDSHPMGFYVGGGTDSVYSFVFCPKGWFYKAFLSDTTATLSYSHKQIWKCKGA